MNHCTRCLVAIHCQHSNCPLCNKPLISKENSMTVYPKYQQRTQESSVRLKLLIFLTLTINILSVTINALTYKINPILWAPIITTGLFYLWIAYKTTFASNSHIGKKILVHYTALSFFLVVIDRCTGFQGWSTSYTIPLFGITATFLMTILAIRKQSLWQSDIGYILAMFFVNIIPTLLFLFHFSTVIWPSVAAIIFSIITIMGMLTFYQRRFKSELQKRFHF